MSTIATVLTSTVIGAIISALVLKQNNDKTMSLKYITEERAKWRGIVKTTTSIIYASESPKDLKEEITLLRLSLNPLTNESNQLDLTILELLSEIESGNMDDKVFIAFRHLIGLLLKHDWERSKLETNSYSKDSEEKVKLALQEFTDWYGRNKNDLDLR